MRTFMYTMLHILRAGRDTHAEMGNMVSPYSGMTYAHISARRTVRHFLHQRHMDLARRGNGNRAWKRAQQIRNKGR